MALGIRLIPEALRSLAFGSIGAGYTAIGTAFGNPVRIMHLTNDTDESLLFSLDGVNDHIFLPSGGFILLDVTANKTRDTGFFIAEGERMYVKQSGVPTMNSVYLAIFHGKEII